MIVIDTNTLDTLTSQASASPRKRQGRNYHNVLSDPIQRMLNAFEPGTYVRPHRHINPDKREVFIILKGRLLVIFFDNEGNITRQIKLDQTNGIFAVEIEVGEWHMAIGLDHGTVVYEIKDGPYDPDTDKEFASWAPAENDPLADQYLQGLLKSK